MSEANSGVAGGAKERAAGAAGGPGDEGGRVGAAPRRALILGGAGFIGGNLCRAIWQAGGEAAIFDNLSRAGSERTLAALRAESRARGAELEFIAGDVRDRAAVAAAVAGRDAVFHLAAQVAVTTAIADPRADFEVNLLGTFNVLEAARAEAPPPFVLFSSTNKVYGELAARGQGAAGASAAGDGGGEARAVAEAQPLDFHSPYGCSKGAADQYTRDYARIYGVPTVVFRLSCIYGPGQNGNEDQGWVAHFARRALLNQPIVIYGDGEQKRDLLYVGDLTEAMLLAWRLRDRAAGQIFNLGGGRERLRSLREVLAELEALLGRPLAPRRGPARPGDQRYYCSDYGRFQALSGWRPRVEVGEGLRRLCAWLRESEGESTTAAGHAAAPEAEARTAGAEATRAAGAEATRAAGAPGEAA